MAVSQSLNLTQQSQNVTSNFSRVRILWKSTQSGNSHNLTQRTAYYYVSINGGSEVEYSVTYTLPKNTTQTIVDTTITVPHTDNGKGSISVRTWMDTRISAGEVELSKSLTLSQIARASTIGATDADIGSASSIVVTRQSTAYTHSIHFVFGRISGYIKADGSISSSEVKTTATSIAFTLPEDFYYQITDAKRGVCTLTCKTYSGNTQIGEAVSTTFNVKTDPLLVSPSVSAAIVDINDVTIALTGNPEIFVKGVSTCLCTIESTAKYGASIVSMEIDGSVVAEGTKTIQKITKDSILFVAKDTRTYAVYTYRYPTYIEYVKLTANATLVRVDPTSGNATLTIWGNYFNGSFGAVVNSLTVKYKIKKANGDFGYYTTVSATINEDENTYSVSVPLTGLDYQYSYTVQVAVEDAVGIKYAVVTVSQGIPAFDWGEKDFRFNVPLLLTNRNYGDTLPTEELKKGQIFFLKNSGDGYTIRIYNGSKWL